MIASFSGPHRFLSNFYPAAVQLDGLPFTTVEAAFQAAKTLAPEMRGRFTTLSPADAKRLGRMMQLRGDWEGVKRTVMRERLRQKFAPGTTLRAQLDATAPQELIEGNTWGDTYWGVCRGVGENWLGKLLMEIRDDRT